MMRWVDPSPCTNETAVGNSYATALEPLQQPDTRSHSGTATCASSFPFPTQNPPSACTLGTSPPARRLLSSPESWFLCENPKSFHLSIPRNPKFASRYTKAEFPATDCVFHSTSNHVKVLAMGQGSGYSTAGHSNNLVPKLHLKVLQEPWRRVWIGN